MYFKVEVEHDREDTVERLAAEIERHIRKLYVVRRVEFSHAVARGED